MNRLAGNTKFRNPYEDKGVILVPISDEIVNDENLEPQMIRVRSNNNSYIFIDNEIRKDDTNPVDLILGGNNSVLFARKIRRWAVAQFNISWTVPNVNPRNNVLTFEYNLPGNRETITIPEGFYSSQEQLLDELIAQLNTKTGITGITFSYSQPQDTAGNVINRRCATISGAGGTFRFYDEATGLTSPMIQRGEHLINLSTNNTFTTSKNAGSINLQYTRYFDITSFALNQYTKNPSSSNALGATNIVIRVPITDRDAHIEIYELRNLSWVNYNSSQTLTNIDFQLVDEHGELLYVGDCHNGDGTKSNFVWAIDILTEI